MTDTPTAEPRLIEGGVGVDDRGEVRFVNAFAFEGVKRFYAVRNHQAGFVRAWHGHRREGKYVYVARGAAIVAAVRVDDWEHPSKELSIQRYVLSETKPGVLYIPPGYANGFMALAPDIEVLFFSTSTLEESRGDDVRFDARYWDAWGIVER